MDWKEFFSCSKEASHSIMNNRRTEAWLVLKCSVASCPSSNVINVECIATLGIDILLLQLLRLLLSGFRRALSHSMYWIFGRRSEGFGSCCLSLGLRATMDRGRPLSSLRAKVNLTSFDRVNGEMTGECARVDAHHRCCCCRTPELDFWGKPSASYSCCFFFRGELFPSGRNRDLGGLIRRSFMASFHSRLSEK